MPPLKRIKELQSLSRDHHHALLLCWKIKMGLSRNVEVQRISDYMTWFYREYLLPHFSKEEQSVFPILGMNHELVIQAMSEHERLRSLFELTHWDEEALRQISQYLDEHIRFEERQLFPAVQVNAGQEELVRLFSLQLKEKPFRENVSDPFWV